MASRSATGSTAAETGRQANSALRQIVIIRMPCDSSTKAYVAQRTTQGKTTKEIMRFLKRYVAREIYKALVTHARITSPQVTRRGCSISFSPRLDIGVPYVQPRPGWRPRGKGGIEGGAVLTAAPR